MAAVNAVIDRFGGPEFRIYAGGPPLLNAALMASLIQDIVRFTLLSTALIGIFLFIVLRQISAVVIPLSVALLALVTTLGVMGATGRPSRRARGLTS